MPKVTHLRPQAADAPACEPVPAIERRELLTIADQLEASARLLRQLAEPDAEKRRRHGSDVSEDTDLLYGVAQIAKYLGLREKQARNRCDRGEVPTFKLGGTVCARKSTILNWIEAQERRFQGGCA